MHGVSQTVHHRTPVEMENPGEKSSHFHANQKVDTGQWLSPRRMGTLWLHLTICCAGRFIVLPQYSTEDLVISYSLGNFTFV